MIEGIKQMHDEGLNCFQDLIQSVALWWGRSYELMFVDAWGFVYQSLNGKSGPRLGDRVGAGTGDYQKSLELYHGIHTEYYEKTVPEVLQIVQKELSEGRPVMIPMDSFFCPWDVGFQRNHSMHGFLAVGLDDDHLYCVDGVYYQQDAPLELEYFQQGCMGCITLSISGDEAKDVDWQKILKEAVARLQGQRGIPNAFDAMRIFAGELPEALNFQVEMEGCEYFWLSPLIRQIWDICRGRKQFAKLLRFLGDRNGFTGLQALGDDLEQTGWRWDTIRSILIKASMLTDPTLVLARTTSKIRDIIVLEEQIAKKLEEGNFETVSEKVSKVSTTRISGKTGEVTFLDLSDYFNNQGFGGAESQSANLIGNGSYFLTNGLPIERIWRVGEMWFQFPNPAEGVQDNISCGGQTIPAPPGRYSRIMTLGCAEWSNFSDKILIQYADGRSEEAPLEFTDCCYPPVFGESTAWTGRGTRRNQGVFEPILQEMRLYAKSCPLNTGGEVISIRLPDCPNLHVFAISLEVS